VGTQLGITFDNLLIRGRMKIVAFFDSAVLTTPEEADAKPLSLRVVFSNAFN